MKPGECYKRWRHTRGYGVHSPYAYLLVTTVVRPPRGYAYYGYSETDMFARNSREIRGARMLLRLLNFLRPKAVYLPPASAECYKASIRCAIPDVRLIADADLLQEAELILCTGHTIHDRVLSEFLTKPNCAIAVADCSPHLRQVIFGALPQGVMLYGEHNIIVVNRPYMQKVAVSVRI